MGDWEKYCDAIGMDMGSSESYDNWIDSLDSDTRPRRRARSTLSSRTPELKFSTFREASEWSKSNGGKAFTRSPDGLYFVPVPPKAR